MPSTCDKEQQLSQFREDLRQMGPDGTLPEKSETLGEYLKRLFPEPGDFVQVHPEHIAAWKELI